MSEAERSLTAAWWIVDDLVRSGLEHACVAPGSRSTPIALALWRHPRVRVHVHLDERSASFFGLGIAKATGRPVAVATTSGTAVAELFPAVVEASMSRTTVVLLTADRPPELRSVGANQTIDQPGIFGRYVRASVDAPVPGEERSRERWRELVGGAMRASMGPPPGPVHLNLPFREPLLPGHVALQAADASGPEHSISEDAAPEEHTALLEALGSTDRGLILVGTLRETRTSVVELAERARWPLLAEPTSGLRVPGSLSAGQHLLGDGRFVERHLPQVALQFGAAPTSRAGLELVRRAGRLVIVDPDHVVADPHRRASLTVNADLAGLVPELLDATPAREATPWWRSWHEADDAARAAVDEILDRQGDPFEGRVARDVAATVPNDSLLAVGSSKPVRDLDAFMAPREVLHVLANRGASGIDGFVSTVLGIAAVHRPTFALLGDLTFLHDVGGLLWSARLGSEAVLVVVNNGGGALFDQLPQRDLPELDPLFVIPHALDLEEVCAAAGAGHERVERATELRPALERAGRSGGVRIIEVVVDRERELARRSEIRAAVASALPSSDR